MAPSVQRLGPVNTDQLRHYRDAMTEQIAWVDSQLKSQVELSIPLHERSLVRSVVHSGDVARADTALIAPYAALRPP